MGNIVAIVGRPNVGKSTLFNRLMGEFKAIVDDFSGVTRDRHYGKAEWQNKEFVLIDTGGYVHNSTDIFESAIRDQVKIAIDEADVILFMVDVQTGITDLDSAFANLLRRSKKPTLVVVNKCDTFDKEHDSYEFYGLGFDKLFCISSGSGSGTGELLDEIISIIPDENLVITEEEEIQIPKIAVVGRPNVGKSSLVNALLGEERNIVTDIAGTTRDTINSHYKFFGNEFLLVDTAGIRRKKKVNEDIEFYSVMRSLRALENCDIAILVLDAQLGLDQQDLNLVSLAVKNGKGLVILVNKWDLMAKETNTARNFEMEIKEKLKPFDDVPIIFTSAIEKQRIHRAVEVAMEVYENRTRRISTSKLNEFVEQIIAAYPPPSVKGKFISIKYATQLPGRSPKFVFFCNLPQYINDSYKRYIENKIREEYNFSGVPITIYFRKK
ncbi:MAG: ribosome biogenesis GTPase Der [Bacteroidia bacterium]|nr:ribosome biogenesis GTPase Der [Bacteroidia bacterium]